MICGKFSSAMISAPRAMSTPWLRNRYERPPPPMMPLESTAMGAISNPNNQGRSSNARGCGAVGSFRSFVGMATEGYHGVAGHLLWMGERTHGVRRRLVI